MNAKTGMAILAGAVALFVTGYLIFGLALAGFYESNAGTATGVNREAPQFVWLILSTLAFAAVLTVVLGWAGAKDVASGLKTAAIFGLLLGLAIDFGFYSMTNIQNLTITLVNPGGGAIHSEIGGAVIGMMLGRGDSA